MRPRHRQLEVRWPDYSSQGEKSREPSSNFIPLKQENDSESDINEGKGVLLHQ